MSSSGPAPKPKGPKNRQVVRPLTGPVLGIAILAFLAWGVVDAATKGSWEFMASAAPWMALLAWFLIVVWIMPCVAAQDDGVEVVGVLKRWWIPWDALADVRQAMVLTLRCKDGTEVSCFSAPSKGVERRAARGLRPGDYQPTQAPTGRESARDPRTIIGTRWTRATGGPDAVVEGEAGPGPVVTWRWPSLLAGAAIALWCLATLAF